MGVDFSGLIEFDSLLGQILEEAPEKKRELHEQLAGIAAQEVDSALSAAGLANAGGRVRRWQVKRVGIGGGYAAVSPRKGALPPNHTGRAYSYGHITSALEHGHPIRGPGSSPSYRPRIKRPSVGGYHFYQAARTTVEAKAIQASNDFMSRLAERLEGKG